jgi:hypothetical protein
MQRALAAHQRARWHQQLLDQNAVREMLRRQMTYKEAVAMARNLAV